MTKTMTAAARTAAPPPSDGGRPVRLGGTDVAREAAGAQREMERRREVFDARGPQLGLPETIRLWGEYEHAKLRYERLKRRLGGPTAHAGGAQEPQDVPDEPLVRPVSYDGRPSSCGQTGPPHARLGGERRPVVDTRSQEQRTAEARLVEHLAAQGFAGPDHDRFLDGLARHGLAVIKPWVRTGYIFERCAARRVRGLPSSIPGSWSPEDIEELVLDTVARAITVFERDALHGRRWTPDGGASLATYFIGTCLFAFAEVYRRRHTEWQRRLRIESAVRRERPDDLPDVAESVVEQATVMGFLAATTPDPRMRLVAYLHCEGHTHAEIAAVLADGTGARAVEGMLYRYRRQLAQDRKAARDDE
ncbi:hypothetical protein [Actinomadura sp. DC4]|uniref:RNA polymerase sigma factor n=1 Tax=Actinomadura sp. DC4 TaxID=3055069 RepID=UPI0025B004A6|nr:hypothetical protein [Actinomadura sp. DC4]MDN3351864.1 hypothetical protein [Actinomadura sp. DC4]